MTGAVNFNNQSKYFYIKIDNIISNDSLPVEVNIMKFFLLLLFSRTGLLQEFAPFVFLSEGILDNDYKGDLLQSFFEWKTL